jgi:hypothetical protein
LLKLEFVEALADVSATKVRPLAQPDFDGERFIDWNSLVGHRRVDLQGFGHLHSQNLPQFVAPAFDDGFGTCITGFSIQLCHEQA